MTIPETTAGTPISSLSIARIRPARWVTASEHVFLLLQVGVPLMHVVVGVGVAVAEREHGSVEH
jgi:hypothetical protein